MKKEITKKIEEPTPSMSETPTPAINNVEPIVPNSSIAPAKKEQGDNYRDENRDDQNGKYYSHHDKSNYVNNHDKKDYNGDKV